MIDTLATYAAFVGVVWGLLAYYAWHESGRNRP